MNLSNAENINHLWGKLIIEELIRNGVDYFCICPGSRSTPLTYSVATNQKAKSIVHFDERGAGFHALGYASAKGAPCAIITTSGTAVANLFPSIIEASKKKQPIIILTADRPPELRFTGAHQTIDQVKIFNQYARWQFDMPTPTKEIAPEFVLTTVDQAVSMAHGELKGPVHINCMFREPLAPIKTKTTFLSYTQSIKNWQKSKQVYTKYLKTNHQMDKPLLDECITTINRAHNGIIVVGKLANEDEQKSVVKLAEKLNWPIFPDVTSGLRLGNTHKNIISYFDQILLSNSVAKKANIDAVLHLGGRITSIRWYQFTKKVQPKHYIMVLNHPLRNDPLHCVTLRVKSTISQFCNTLSTLIKKKNKNKCLDYFINVNARIDETIETYFNANKKLSELEIARIISQLIPTNHGIFLASSLPVREMDMYADFKNNNVLIGSNRGASGIDGTIATSIGFSAGLSKPVTTLIGDLAFLHDLNSLAMIKELKWPTCFVVLNNDGGGIFNFLEIAQNKKIFDKFFGTPHGLTFKAVGELFNIEYSEPKNNNDFKKIYRKALSSKKHSIIEIKSNRQNNLAHHKELQSKILSVTK